MRHRRLYMLAIALCGGFCIYVNQAQAEPARQVKPPIKHTLSDLQGAPKDVFSEKNFSSHLDKQQRRFKLAEKRLHTNPDRSSLIPYSIRAIYDQEAGVATPSERKLVALLEAAGIKKKLLQKYFDLPPTTAAALGDEFYAAKTPAEADTLLLKSFQRAATKTRGEISQAGPYTYETAFRVLSVPVKGHAYRMHQQATTCPSKPTDIFRLRVEYRGVSTYTVSDRGGTGADPYLLTSFYRTPCGTQSLQTMTAPMKVKHRPEDLPEMGTNEWSPSGGHQDANGNPSNPIQFYPNFEETVNIDFVELHFHDCGLGFGGNCPNNGTSLPCANGTNISFAPCMHYHHTSIPQTIHGTPHPIGDSPILDGSDMYFALVSVWEEDGDDASSLLSAFGSFAMSVGEWLAPPVDSVVVVLGAALELASFATASSDDSIGDYVVLFDKSELAITGYREIGTEVSGDDNKWKIWIGAESKRVP